LELRDIKLILIFRLSTRKISGKVIGKSMRKDKEDEFVIKDAKKVMLDGPAKVAARAVVEKSKVKPELPGGVCALSSMRTGQRKFWVFGQIARGVAE